jgi:hypothetical protein
MTRNEAANLTRRQRAERRDVRRLEPESGADRSAGPAARALGGLRYRRRVSWASLAPNGTEWQSVCQSARQRAGRTELAGWVSGAVLAHHGNEE